MTHNPYQQPSDTGANSPHGTPPYQQGPNGVPPYQQGAPSYHETSGPYVNQQGYQAPNAGPFGQPGSTTYGHPGQAPYVNAGSSVPASEERTWSILAHIAPVVGALISVGWLNFVGPLVIYLVYKDRSPRIRKAASGAFNFSATLWVANAVAWVCAVTVILLPVAIILWIAAGLGLFVVHIMAAVKAANDEPYTYPLQIPILK